MAAYGRELTDEEVRKIAYNFWSLYTSNGYCANLEKIKDDLGIQKSLRHNTRSDTTAFVTSVGDKYEININKKVFYSSPKWRYILAHEIGHVALNKEIKLHSIKLDEEDTESLCDLFADELLFPSHALYKKLEEKKWHLLSLEAKIDLLFHISKLSFCHIYNLLKKVISNLRVLNCVVLSCRFEKNNNEWKLGWGIKPPGIKDIYLPWLHNGKRVHPRIKGRLSKVLNDFCAHIHGHSINIMVEELDFGIKKYFLNRGVPVSNNISCVIWPIKETILFDNIIANSKELLLFIPIE